MLTQIKNRILSAIHQLQTVRNAMQVWNYTHSVEKVRKAMAKA